jgi:hypothetical protein
MLLYLLHLEQGFIFNLLGDILDPLVLLSGSKLPILERQFPISNTNFILVRQLRFIKQMHWRISYRHLRLIRPQVLKPIILLWIFQVSIITRRHEPFCSRQGRLFSESIRHAGSARLRTSPSTFHALDTVFFARGLRKRPIQIGCGLVAHYVLAGRIANRLPDRVLQPLHQIFEFLLLRPAYIRQVDVLNVLGIVRFLLNQQRFELFFGFLHFLAHLLLLSPALVKFTFVSLRRLLLLKINA